MTNLSLKENTESFITRLTNLLFVVVITYPFLESLTSVLLKEEQFTLWDVLSGEFLRTFLPYLIGVWLYFYSTQRMLSDKALHPFPQDDPREKNIQDWLKEAGVHHAMVFVSAQKDISAQAFGTKKHGYISITQTALEGLKDDELRALVTHEAAHHFYGDHWKLSLARSLTIAILISRLAMSAASFPSTINIKESEASTLLFFLPAILGYFAYALMSVGVLAIVRLRELMADNFALSIFGDASVYVRLMAKISYATQPSSKKIKLSLPKSFEFHPDGLKRLRSLNTPDLFLEDIYFALAFLGLLLGALIGIHGVPSISILFGLPTAFILGAPLLYFVTNRLEQYGHKIPMVFIFTGSTSLTTMLLTMTWQIVRISNPLSVSQVDVNSLTEEYYLTPLPALTSDFRLLFDNYLVTFFAGGLFLVVFLFLVGIIKRVTTRTSVRHTRIKSILILLLWVILAVTLALSWLNAFGPFPALKYLPHWFGR